MFVQFCSDLVTTVSSNDLMKVVSSAKVQLSKRHKHIKLSNYSRTGCRTIVVCRTVRH